MFTHLNVSSWFSFGRGASSPEALARAAAERGFSALALTDTNGVYGAIPFQNACDHAGIRPILGARLVTGGSEAIALAEDARGWSALCRAITAIHWHDDLDLAHQLAEDRDGLVILSHDIDLLDRLIRLSGPASMHAALIPGRDRHRVLAAARRLGIPVVVTGAVVMAHRSDIERQRMITAIHANGTLSSRPDTDDLQSAWLCPADDIARHFPDIPEACDAAGVIADRCRHRIAIGRTIAPRMADVADATLRLRTLAEEGAVRCYGSVTGAVRDRLDHEIAIIAAKGFADYFLIVRDILDAGITHCGRGSVANSIVSYCLGITHVDPLAAGLLFERFLNPARKDPPDIDLDFPWDERDRLLASVFRKHPMPGAAMVCNHNALRLPGALREVAKVYGRPATEIREVTRRIPWHDEHRSARTLIATHPNFRGLDLPAIWQRIADFAESLVGTPRHLSLHPGGVVIVPGALTDVVPVERAAKKLDGFPDLTVPMIQFEKDGAEDAGLVKIDLLGNRSLAVIRDAIEMVHRNTGVRLDYTSHQAGRDPAARQLFRTGNTLGVFYTESPASRLLNLRSRADSYELLVLNTSIIRPASYKWIDIYLERLHGDGNYPPLHESIRETLAKSYGVMVYQEDVVNVAHDFAGLDWAAADGIRKALSKKRPEKHLAAYFEEFTAGARALGRDDDAIARVWENILSFAGYSFCKGHSCSYIEVAQQSCYLRANHPAEFIAAVLANGGGFYRPFVYVAEAMRMGVRVLPPDVNRSEWCCLGGKHRLRIGFQFIKGFSAEAAGRIVRERETGGAYRSLADLRNRTALPADELRLLIKVGACDAIAGALNRPQMLWMIDTTAAKTPLPLAAAPRTPPLRDYSPDRKRRDAQALLGFCTDVHPMTLHADVLAHLAVVKSTELHLHVGRYVIAAGMYATGKPVQTAAHEPMQFATFDDGHGLIEAVVFPDVYAARSHILFDQGPFVLRGMVEESYGAITITVTHLERLAALAGRRGRADIASM